MSELFWLWFGVIWALGGVLTLAWVAYGLLKDERLMARLRALEATVGSRLVTTVLLSVSSLIAWRYRHGKLPED
jgi:hypothetical protein